MHDGENDEAGHPEIAGMNMPGGVHGRRHAGDKKKRRHESAGQNHPDNAFSGHFSTGLFCNFVPGTLNPKN